MWLSVHSTHRLLSLVPGSVTRQVLIEKKPYYTCVPNQPYPPPQSKDLKINLPPMTYIAQVY